MQVVIRHEVGGEVMPDCDHAVQDYATAKYLPSQQGLVQKWIVNTFSTKHTGLILN